MFLKRNLPAFFWTLVIFGLCSMPGKSIPHISWLELASFDKFVHASIFFILQILYMRGFSLQTTYPLLQKNYKWIPFVLCVAYGGALEIMQGAFFSERSPDILDFTANSIGCLLALILFKPLSARFSFLRN